MKVTTRIKTGLYNLSLGEVRPEEKLASKLSYQEYTHFSKVFCDTEKVEDKLNKLELNEKYLTKYIKTLKNISKRIDTLFSKKITDKIIKVFQDKNGKTHKKEMILEGKVIKKIDSFNRLNIEIKIDLPLVKRASKNFDRIELKEDDIKSLKEKVNKHYSLIKHFIEKYERLVNILENAVNGYELQIAKNIKDEDIELVHNYLLADDKLKFLKDNNFKGLENFNVYEREDDGFGYENVRFTNIYFKDREVVILTGNSSD